MASCAVLRGLCITQMCKSLKPHSIRQLSFSASLSAKQPKTFYTNIGACGPLIDGPDYTFLDGRPTPLGVRQKKRLVKQKEVNEKVLQLLRETEYAVSQHKASKEQESAKRSNEMAKKLKPKGHLYKGST